MNITFAITSYEDSVLAAQSAAAAKTLYPSAQIVQLSDLAPNRLKLPQFAGAWTERWMKATLATNADIIIKIDPDTRAYNAVTTFPTTDIFGQIAENGIYWNVKGVIHGAAIGFQRSAIQKIVDSGLLLDKKYTTKPYLYSRDMTEAISLQDPIVHDVALRLGLTMGAWAGLQLFTKWQQPTVDKSTATFAHPVRN
jgi:hypothetical protein